MSQFVSPDIPTRLDGARGRLSVRLYGTAAHAVRSLELQRQQAAAATPAVRSVGGDVLAGVVLDAGDSLVPLPLDLLTQTWRTTIDEVIDVAYEGVLGQEFSGFIQLAEGAYAITDERFAGAAMVRPSMLSGLAVQGDLVALAATSNGLLITGSQDVAGLRTIVETAAQAVGNAADLVSADPLVLSSGGWAPFAWPADPGLRLSAENTRRAFAAALYARQRAALQGEAAYVADAKLYGGPDGRHILVASWTRGTRTLLPVVDDVVVVEVSGELKKMSFGAFLDAAGSAVRDTGLIPPRFEVPAELPL